MCVCARARAFNLVKGHQKATFKLKRVSADTRGSIVANRHDFTPQYDSSVNSKSKRQDSEQRELIVTCTGSLLK